MTDLGAKWGHKYSSPLDSSTTLCGDLSLLFTPYSAGKQSDISISTPSTLNDVLGRHVGVALFTIHA